MKKKFVAPTIDILFLYERNVLTASDGYAHDSEQETWDHAGGLF